jgi:iron complex transport system substrate-binding protein
VASLIRDGIEVHAFNQRSVASILDMVRMVGAIIGKPQEGMRLAERLLCGLEAIRSEAQRLPRRPRVYFEEWDEPMISAIGWVSEIIDAAGGVDVFADRALAKSAKDRIVSAEEVIAAAPDIIIGSWCGKRFRPERVSRRSGFDGIPAVKSGALHETKSSIILQPGPAALTEGASAVAAIIRDWRPDHA